MSQYAQRHNFDNVNHQEPIYFDSAKEAFEHVESCGYWSEPIQFNNPEADQSFSSQYVATDWSESGLVHFRKH